MNTYDKNQITQMLTQYIKDELIDGLEGFDLQPDTPLVEHRIVDSMGLFRMIAFLEESFELEIEANDVLPQRFATVTAIVDFVAEKINDDNTPE